MIDLQPLVDNFSEGIAAADARSPVAVNQRTRKAFQPRTGPHTASLAIRMTLAEMQAMYPTRYGAAEFDVPYPNRSRQNCDLTITSQRDTLCIESKLLRTLGDNGKTNDNIVMHILSPYPRHRSVLTDCEKLRRSGFEGRKAVLIFGYEGNDWPLEPAINAFEVLAREQGSVGQRRNTEFSGLCHPVHRAGRVFV